MKFTEALFVLVARDPLNRGAAFINPLELGSQEERDIFQLGEHNKRRWVVCKPPPTPLKVWLQALRDFAGFAVQNPAVAGGAGDHSQLLHQHSRPQGHVVQGADQA